ncbi:hypothetical protein ILYODFUR_036845 [Ilyodon furcidens]|uniref:Uncharacterized protein n=1 Tax=Ilyodon furcidens TaxID=33524 RepID=A0ABV0STX2_9TELE
MPPKCSAGFSRYRQKTPARRSLHIWCSQLQPLKSVHQSTHLISRRFRFSTPLLNCGSDEVNHQSPDARYTATTTGTPIASI